MIPTIIAMFYISGIWCKAISNQGVELRNEGGRVRDGGADRTTEFKAQVQ